MNRARVLKIVVLLAGVTLLLADFAEGDTQVKEKLAMQKSHLFAHAGVEIALPKGFEFSANQHPTHIATAILASGGDVLQQVMLSGYIVRKPTSTDQYSRWFPSLASPGEQLGLNYISRRKNPRIKNLKILSQINLPIATLNGAAQVIRYTEGQIGVYVAEVCFLRDLPGGKLQMCYVLRVDSAATQKASLLDIFGAVTKALKLTKITSPLEMSIVKKSASAVSPTLRASIQIPLGWYAIDRGAMISFGQMDYLTANGEAITGYVAIGLEAGTFTAQSYIENIIKQADLHETVDVTILTDTKVKIGSADGWQLISRFTKKTSAKTIAPQTEEIMIIARRVLTKPTPDEKTEITKFQLIFQADVDIKTITDAMNILTDNYSRKP